MLIKWEVLKSIDKKKKTEGKLCPILALKEQFLKNYELQNLRWESLISYIINQSYANFVYNLSWRIYYTKNNKFQNMMIESGFRHQ